MRIDNYDEEILDDNQEIAEDIEPFNPADIVVYSRDWTIETIYAQIKQNNIDLNPRFQRRNAWTDDKRSKLIESVLIGYPVPEIVLAEDTTKKRAFIVIDGKQRLLSIAGFIDNEQYEYWHNPKLRGLTVKSKLNGLTFNSLKSNPEYSDELREFFNSSLRCTVITNYKQNDVLYDIFYRLNSGSTPLSTQELRQVLNRGEFANFLIATTNIPQPIHMVMNLDGPDKRLRDIEIILRLITFLIFPQDYQGNLKKFLDEKMKFITDNWRGISNKVEGTYKDINIAIESLSITLLGYTKIGRKTTNSVFETRFNRVLFEVQIYYQMHVQDLEEVNSELFIMEFNVLCEDSIFRSSIESSTKNMDSYRNRYSKYQDFINKVYGINIDVNPYQ